MSQNDSENNAIWLESLQQTRGNPAKIDDIISGYEERISKNIASKIIAASKRTVAPEFTKEELLYLNKRAEEIDDTELKVITPAPVITLKKGKTELNIGHAATLVQKMEEKYPTSKKPLEIPIVDINIEKPVEDITDEDLTHIVKNLKPGQSTSITIPSESKSVNKNAYEIREAVLSHALNWVQYSYELQRPAGKLPSEDDVLTVAQKFYKFVENRR